MRYYCIRCNYIYDEGIGDKRDGIEAGTSINNLKVCPHCEEVDSFQGFIEEVNYVSNKDDMDYLELEHIPYLQIRDYDDKKILKVIIGKSEHIMGEDHMITSISLYDEYGDLVEEEFLVEGKSPEIEFDISDLDDFEVRCRCSVHGVWGIKYNI